MRPCLLTREVENSFPCMIGIDGQLILWQGKAGSSFSVS